MFFTPTTAKYVGRKMCNFFLKKKNIQHCLCISKNEKKKKTRISLYCVELLQTVYLAFATDDEI